MGLKSAGLTALALASLTIWSVGAQAQTLTDALINAYHNAAQLKSGRAALRGADESVAQAFAATRMSVDLSGSSSGTYLSVPLPTSGASHMSYASSLSLSAKLLIWDGNGSKLAIEAATQNILAARTNLIDTEQLVLLNAVSAFMNMRRDAQFLQLAENNKSVIARQVQAAKDRFEVGEIRRTDVSQAEARLAGALSMVALRQGNLEISRGAYYLATGTYPGVLRAPPPTPKLPSTLARATSIALQKHPSVQRAKYVAKLAQINIYRAEAAMKPKISLAGNLNVTANAMTGDTASISIIGSAPIYHGGALTSALRQSRAIKEQSRADLQRAGQVVTQNVRMFWARLQIARASITARQKEVRASRTALRGIREEANLGARTTLDVLDAERQLVQAETDLASAKRDEYVAVYSLLSGMGLLTVSHLQLGIKTYDAVAHFKKVKKAPGPTRRGKLLSKILTRAGKN